MDWSWLGRWWKLFVYLPVFLYVASVYVSLLILFVMANLGLATAIILSSAVSAVLLGVAIGYLFYVAGVMKIKMKNSPTMHWGYALAFLVLTGLVALTFFIAVKLAIPPNIQVAKYAVKAYFTLMLAGLVMSLIGTTATVTGMASYNSLIRGKPVTTIEKVPLPPWEFLQRIIIIGAIIEALGIITLVLTPKPWVLIQAITLTYMILTAVAIVAYYLYLVVKTKKLWLRT
jgi:hypothetical protein